jgi:hypothetical protein
VLDHEQGDRGAGLELVGEVFDVLLADEVVDLVDEGVVGNEDVVVELAQLERRDGAVGVLGEEQEVDDTDRARLHEVGEGGGDLAVEPVVGEPDHEHFDGTQAHGALLQAWLQAGD